MWKDDNFNENNKEPYLCFSVYSAMITYGVCSTFLLVCLKRGLMSKAPSKRSHPIRHTVKKRDNRRESGLLNVWKFINVHCDYYSRCDINKEEGSGECLCVYVCCVCVI